MNKSQFLVEAVKNNKKTIVVGGKTVDISGLTYNPNPGYAPYVEGDCTVVALPANYNNVLKNDKGTKFGIANIKVTSLGILNSYITTMIVFEKNKDLISVGSTARFGISETEGVNAQGKSCFNVQHQLAGRVSTDELVFDELVADNDAAINTKINADLVEA